MSSLKAAKHQIAIQQSIEVCALAAAADRAALDGDRENCIDIVARIYSLLDSAYSNR